MPEGVDATSFEFYEGIRIFVPGTLAVGIADGVARTVSTDGHGLGLGTVQAVVAALAAGLVFYFVDAPSKAAVMTPLQPTSHLAQWKLRTKPGTGLLNNYFVMLDVLIPAGIKARALYMGSMFRIGYEAIYMLAFASVAMLSLNVWTTSRFNPSTHNVAVDGWLVGLAVVVIYMTALRRDLGASRRRRSRPVPTDMDAQNFNFFDNLVCAAVAAVTILMLLFGYALHVPTFVLGVPAAVALALWLYRYFKGYQLQADVTQREASATTTATPEANTTANDPGRRAGFQGLVDRWLPSQPRRRPIGAAQATLILGTAVLGAVATLSAQPLAKSSLSSQELRAWSLGAVLTLVLVAARGHEKRLKGAYATQNTWLTLNKDTVVEKYFVADDSQPEGTPTGSATPSSSGDRTSLDTSTSTGTGTGTESGR